MNAVAFGRHTLADQAFIKYLITKMFFALLLLVISSFHNAWAYRFLECDGCDSPFPPNTCWNHQPMKFKSGPIVFELQRQAFPDNSDNAKALEIATKRWEQLANVQFEREYQTVWWTLTPISLTKLVSVVSRKEREQRLHKT